jgi:hypothetical protein
MLNGSERLEQFVLATMKTAITDKATKVRLEKFVILKYFGHLDVFITFSSSLGATTLTERTYFRIRRFPGTFFKT